MTLDPQNARPTGIDPTGTETVLPRSRKVRVLATLGPASDTPEMIATA